MSGIVPPNIPAPNSVAPSQLTQNARPDTNNLDSLNAAFDNALQNGPGPAAVANDDDGPDQWRSSVEAGGQDYSRVAGGANAANAANWDKTVGAGKIVISSWLESSESLSKAGVDQFFQADLGGDLARTLHMALLGNTGPADSIPVPLVTAYNAPGVNPTFDAAISTILEIPVSAPGGGGFGTFGLATTPGSFPNLGVAVWSDAALGVGEMLALKRAGMFVGNALRNVESRPQAAALESVQRFFEKSYDNDTPPGSAVLAGAKVFLANGAIGGEKLDVEFRTTKRVPPAVTLFSPVTGAAGFWHDFTAAIDIPAAPGAIGQTGFEVMLPPVPAGNEVRGHWSASARL